MQVETILRIVAAVSIGLAGAGFAFGYILGKNARKLLPGWIFPLIYIAAVILVVLVALPVSKNIGPIVIWELLLQMSGVLLSFFSGYGLGIKAPIDRATQVRGISWLILIIGMAAESGGYLLCKQAASAVNQLGIIKQTKYEPQKNKECPENLKSLYNAISLYSQDWDALPPAEKWLENEELTSKIRQNEWLHCPAVSNRQDDKYGYAFNDKVSALKLNGKALHDIPNAQKLPLLYDSSALVRSAHDNFSSLPKPGRHGGRDNILFCDGHVEAVIP